ncbi:stomatin family protein [Lentinula edodes]|uniref:Stomatin family protein n=1 Tax=Lentinula edodes TaxID=5353 RepID=A0A1Q3EBV3_LENED|nr:stomatin family protein [Lentinula edodes]
MRRTDSFLALEGDFSLSIDGKVTPRPGTLESGKLSIQLEPLMPPSGTRNVLRATRQGVRRPTGARTIVTVIQQGYEGWRLSFGRNPVRLPPGINLKIPVYHTVQVVDLRESSISIPNLPGYTSDNASANLITSSLYLIVMTGSSDLFRLAILPHSGWVQSMLQLLGRFSYDQVISDRNGLNEQLNSVIGNTIANWGVHCTRFEVQSFQPANREVERQLELQMEAERNRRKQLLDTQAQINIAEGQKQRVILESEGHLEAKSNEADAKYKTVVREAEASNNP